MQALRIGKNIVARPHISRTGITPAASSGRCFLALLGILYLFSGACVGAQAQLTGVNWPAFEAESPQIARLSEALQHYRRIAAAGGWPVIPAGPTIGPGSLDPRLGALVTRLRATGDLANDGRAFDDYDDVLQAAVRRFQVRHGLEPDALVGRATLRALNTSVDQRINQLCTSLAHARKTFDVQRADFILVNIPAFNATLSLSGKPVWTTNVIIGEKDAKTPLFESRIKTVVVNPTWSVPRSIASEELLPKIQNDINFLARGGYDVFDATGLPVDPLTVDWPSLDMDNFPFRLVQRAGPQNELGRIKFLFPNQYGVCMHDTPGKYLFAYSSRAFSHGCIRMENPVDFAAQLLARDNWSKAQLEAQLASGETKSISLAEPLPIVITYLTASVDASGTVFFYRDIYGWNTRPATCDPGSGQANSIY